MPALRRRASSAWEARRPSPNHLAHELDGGERHEREFFVEAVASQQASIEELERWAFSVQAIHPMNDKQARLRVAACYIKNGTRGSHFTATSSS